MTRLLDAIEDGKTTTAEPTVETMVPCRLVLRESTGPATR
jgi:LacI family transcriptional regulator